MKVKAIVLPVLVLGMSGGAGLAQEKTRFGFESGVHAGGLCGADL